MSKAVINRGRRSRPLRAEFLNLGALMMSKVPKTPKIPIHRETPIQGLNVPPKSRRSASGGNLHPRIQRNPRMQNEPNYNLRNLPTTFCNYVESCQSRDYVVRVQLRNLKKRTQFQFGQLNLNHAHSKAYSRNDAYHTSHSKENKPNLEVADAPCRRRPSAGRDPDHPGNTLTQPTRRRPERVYPQGAKRAERFLRRLRRNMQNKPNVNMGNLPPTPGSKDYPCPRDSGAEKTNPIL